MEQVGDSESTHFQIKIYAKVPGICINVLEPTIEELMETGADNLLQGQGVEMRLTNRDCSGIGSSQCTVQRWLQPNHESTK